MMTISFMIGLLAAELAILVKFVELILAARRYHFLLAALMFLTMISYWWICRRTIALFLVDTGTWVVF